MSPNYGFLTLLGMVLSGQEWPELTEAMRSETQELRHKRSIHHQEE